MRFDDLYHDLLQEDINVKRGRGSSTSLFNNSALSRAISEKNAYNTREIALEIPIDMFIVLAKNLNNISKIKIDSIKSAISTNQKLDDIPYIRIDNDYGDVGSWFVTGHEGRHRSLVLKELGYTTIPVVFKSNSNIKHLRYIDNPKFEISSIKNEDGNRTVRMGLIYSGNRFLSSNPQIKVI
jgi:hypothetical protein